MPSTEGKCVTADTIPLNRCALNGRQIDQVVRRMFMRLNENERRNWTYDYDPASMSAVAIGPDGVEVMIYFIDRERSPALRRDASYEEVTLVVRTDDRFAEAAKRRLQFLAVEFYTQYRDDLDMGLPRAMKRWRSRAGWRFDPLARYRGQSA